MNVRTFESQLELVGLRGFLNESLPIHGKFDSETGMYYYRARYYDTSIVALERFWLRLQGRAPVQSSPYDIIPRYDENGNIVGWTTYDPHVN